MTGQLFKLVLVAIIVWLILDQMFGKKRISTFLKGVFEGGGGNA